jgi:DNA adenine methylase
MITPIAGPSSPAGLLAQLTLGYIPPATPPRKPLNGFAYFGGKYRLIDWLRQILPYAPSYVEPFGGSATVLINLPVHKYEVYNDLDSRVVTFFRVLRERPAELLDNLWLTPYSREEYAKACEFNFQDPAIDDLEKARQYFILITQTIKSTSRPVKAHSWKRALGNEKSHNMASVITGYLHNLSIIAQRLRQVQLENRDACKLIPEMDNQEVLFYCDPPYSADSHDSSGNCYSFDWDGNEGYQRFAAILRKVKGAVAVSGYPSPLMNDLFGDWHCWKTPPRRVASGSAIRQEAVWVNPACLQLQREQKPHLFC